MDRGQNDEFASLYGSSGAAADTPSDAAAPGALDAAPGAAPVSGVVDESESEEESEEEEDEDDDDFNVILTAPAPGSAAAITPSKRRPAAVLKTAEQEAATAAAKSTAAASGLPDADDSVFDLDFAQFDDAPWRRPGADRTDYFNYGFDERTWRAYCQHQLALRQQFAPGSDEKVPTFHAAAQGAGLMPTALQTHPGAAAAAAQQQQQQMQQMQQQQGGFQRPPYQGQGQGQGQQGQYQRPGPGGYNNNSNGGGFNPNNQVKRSRFQ